MRAIMTNARKQGSLSRLLARIFSPGKATEYEAYPEWSCCSPADLQRISGRLTRLSEAYQAEFRSGSAMDVPLRHRLRNQTLQTEKPSHTPGPDAMRVAALLPPAELDMLLRAVLAQLAQLEKLGYVHGAIRPDSLTIHKDRVLWSASVGHFHSGRFTDEPVEKENLAESPWMSPEQWRRIHYPFSAPPADDSDIFSVGCLYYTLLTGEEPSAFPDGGTPAAAISRLLPVLPGRLQGFRASFMLWLLSPVPGDRPSAADALDAFSNACEAGLTTLPPFRLLNRSILRTAGLSILRASVSPVHLANHYLADSGDEQPLLLREHHLLWDPRSLPGPLFNLQRERRTRAVDRLTALCRLSADWHAANPLICVNSLFITPQALLTTSPLTGKETLVLSQLRELNDSVFLLDARMTEILAEVQVLHDAGYFLGCFSEASFYAEIRQHGAVVHLADLSSAAPVNDLPPPCHYVPEPEELRLLSPEMTRYISSGARVSHFDAQLWVSTASDIFTLGLLYHLILSGEYPQLADPSWATFSGALCHDGQPASAFRLSPKIDRQHTRLILRMLALDPIHRPARCADVLKSILDFYTA